MERPFAILHVPHSSVVIPPEVRRSLVLSDDEIESELIRMTDRFTDVLFDCEGGIARRIVFPVSRLVVDPERFVDDGVEPMSQKGMGAIYTKTSSGQDLRGPLSNEERAALVKTYYEPHHRHLNDAVREALISSERCLIVDCHSFPSKPLPYECDQSPDRPDICIGTDEFHTPSWLKNLAVTLFQEAGFRVALDWPFSGSLVPQPYYRVNGAAWSVMIEVNRSLYLQEDSGKLSRSFESLRRKLSVLLRSLISSATVHLKFKRK